MGSAGKRIRMSVSGGAASLGDVIPTGMVHGIGHRFVAVAGLHAAVAWESAASGGMAPLAGRPMRDHLVLAGCD